MLTYIVDVYPIYVLLLCSCLPAALYFTRLQVILLTSSGSTIFMMEVTRFAIMLNKLR